MNSFIRTALASSVVLALLSGGVASAVDEGEVAPGFNVPGLDDGQIVSLAEHRGKVVLLDFWASWCSPCLTSLPQLDQLSREFPRADFQVLAVNVDEDPKKARKFLSEHAVSYPNAMDPNSRLLEQFGLQTIPTSYLIDRNGIVRMVHKGFRPGDIDHIRIEIQKLLDGGLRSRASGNPGTVQTAHTL